MERLLQMERDTARKVASNARDIHQITITCALRAAIQNTDMTPIDSRELWERHRR